MSDETLESFQEIRDLLRKGKENCGSLLQNVFIDELYKLYPGLIFRILSQHGFSEIQIARRAYEPLWRRLFLFSEIITLKYIADASDFHLNILKFSVGLLPEDHLS